MNEKSGVAINKKTIIFLHVCFWAVLFLSPMTLLHRDEPFNLMKYAMVCLSPLSLMVVFYVNYLWLVPQYFFGRERRTYWIVNLVMMIVIGVSIHYWMSFTHFMFATDAHPHPHLSLLHDLLFNIYALTAIDTERAQNAIQQLSKLLRHLLYDNQEQLVDLEKEVQFLESYINLMRIRLPQNVEVTFAYDPPSKPLMVAPLLAVSLVENAFKHGISPTEPSFVHIKIAAGDMMVTCDIENSNHPKSENDRSGHGIGLQQVQRRLDLSYPGRYEWTHGPSPDGKTYHSHLKVYFVP